MNRRLARARRGFAIVGGVLVLAIVATTGSTAVGAPITAPTLVRAEIKGEQQSNLPPVKRSTGGVPGIDVSAYQHGVDWRSVAKAGGRFAYIKATEGTTYTNARLREQYTGAARAGLVRGAFHFAKPNVGTAVEQAAFFVKSLSRLGGGRALASSTLPPLVDLEYDPYIARDGTDECWGLSPRQMVTWIAAFTDTVVALTGRVPAIYTTTHWWTTCTGGSYAFSANPLFLARYVDDPAEGAGALPAGWKRFTIWQYTNRGTRYAGVTDGSSGDTAASDEDVFAGTMADLRALARSTFDSGLGLGRWSSAPFPSL